MVLDIVMWLVVVAAIVGTIANAQQKIWCFPVWATTNAALAVHSYYKGAYPVAGLMVVYFFIALYGWYSWGKLDEERRGKKIR